MKIRHKIKSLFEKPNRRSRRGEAAWGISNPHLDDYSVQRRRSARRAVVLATLSSVTLAGLIIGVVRLVSASGGAQNAAADAAMAATLDELKKNSGAPPDTKSMQQTAANLFVILNSGLAQQDLRKDPTFLAAQSVATASFSDPGALHAKRMEDAGYRRNYNAAMGSFAQQAKKTDVPIKPSATDASQIEALRNDPDWRRQREASLHQLMPPAKGNQ